MTEPSCAFAENHVFPFLIFLTFPTGTLFFFLVGPFIDLYPSVDYSLVCLGTIAVGYFQWFHMIPDWFAGTQLTRLELKQSAVTKEARVPLMLAKPPTCFPIVPFNELGQTPLERALWQEHQSNPTNVSS